MPRTKASQDEKKVKLEIRRQKGEWEVKITSTLPIEELGNIVAKAFMTVVGKHEGGRG